MLSEIRKIEARVLLQQGQTKADIYTEDEYAHLIKELREAHTAKVRDQIYPDFLLYAAPYGVTTEAWRKFAKEVRLLFTSMFHENNPIAESEFNL